MLAYYSAPLSVRVPDTPKVGTSDVASAQPFTDAPVESMEPVSKNAVSTASTKGMEYGDQLSVVGTAREPEAPTRTHTAYPMAAPIGFVGVLVLGIGALYVHKVA